MMVSGIPTASGYEERIRFSELEVVDAGAIDHGVLNSMPEGHYSNGWDVNVAGVRTTSVKRNIRYHKHAVGLLFGIGGEALLTGLQEFILRVKRKSELEFFVGRRYGDFSRLHKRLRTELPGKVLPPMPKKNKQSSTASNLLSAVRGGDDSDASSISSISTMGVPPPIQTSMNNLSVRGKPPQFSILQQKLRAIKDHRRSPSSNSFGGRASPRSSIDSRSINQSPAPAPPASDEVRSHSITL
jgi:hypothetical protein